MEHHPPPHLFGPFHRLESPSQSAEDAAKIVTSGEVWGRPCRNIYQSDMPKAKAFDGPLPSGKRGLQFYTTVAPDKGCVPGQPTWTGTAGEEWVKIPAINIVNTQV
jgi:hypothetical protein